MGYSLLAEIWFLKLSIARRMEILPCKASRTTCRVECERALVLMDLFRLGELSRTACGARTREVELIPDTDSCHYSSHHSKHRSTKRA